MHDIILDDNRQKALKNENNRDKTTIKKKRSFPIYMVDWVEKSIIVATLLIMNFILFANAGSYNIFSSEIILRPEVIYIIAGLGVFSILLMYLVSFSSFLQNLLSALILALFILAMFSQFALFDKESMFSGWIASYFGDNIGVMFNENSHIIFTVAASVFFFFFLSLSSRITIAYFIGILLIITAGIGFDTYLNAHRNTGFRTTYSRKIADSYYDGKKFVFLAFPDFTSYNYLRDLQDNKPARKAYNDKIKSAMDTMLGFYAENNFNFYPNAYVNTTDPYLNLTRTFNPQTRSEDTAENTLSSVVLNSYWNFKDLSNQYLYLKNNKIYDTFLKANYDIKAYESRGIEICYTNNQPSVSKCIKKQNLPIKLENLNLSLGQKIGLLLAQWVESTGLISDFSWLYTGLRLITDADTIPGIGYSTRSFYTVDAVKTLDYLEEDLIKDKGNTAYFAYIDIPSDLYVYDEYCNLKPISQWREKRHLPWVKTNDVFAKREAYADQLKCLFGRMQDFINRLKKHGKDQNTVIVMQGISGLNGLYEIKEKEFIPSFKNENFVNMAIRDPLKKEFTVNDRVCSAANILKGYLYKKTPCVEFAELKLHEAPKKELTEKIKKAPITETDISLAKAAFQSWYGGFNHNLPTQSEEPQVVTEEQINEIGTEKQLNAPALETPDIIQEPEAETKSLSLVAEETAKAEEQEKADSAADVPDTAETVAEEQTKTQETKNPEEPQTTEEGASQAEQTKPEEETAQVPAAEETKAEPAQPEVNVEIIQTIDNEEQ